MAFPSPEASGPSSFPKRSHALGAERPHPVSPAAAAATDPTTSRPASRTGLMARSAPAVTLAVAPVRLAHRSLVSRVGAGRSVPAAAVAILLVATAISSAPALAQPGSVGNTAGGGSEARIAVGGGASAIGGPDDPINGSPYGGLGVIGAVRHRRRDRQRRTDRRPRRDDPGHRDDRRDRVRRRHAAEARRGRHDRRRRQGPDADATRSAPATRSPASPASSASR